MDIPQWSWYVGGMTDNQQAEMKDAGARRTRIVDQHHVYVDIETGWIGRRGDLVILALWDNELPELVKMTTAQRREHYKGAKRYFGDVNEAPTARALERGGK